MNKDSYQHGRPSKKGLEAGTAEFGSLGRTAVLRNVVLLYVIQMVTILAPPKDLLFRTLEPFRASRAHYLCTWGLGYDRRDIDYCHAFCDS